MLNEIIADARESMEKAYDSFNRDLARLRTGRANLSVLDGIRVDYYGTLTPLSQCAAIKIADPRLITIKPWDKSLLVAIEKAIVSSNVGITPNNDGELLRLPIPPLTGETRTELVKQLKRQTEDARVSVRNIRRDANSLIKSADGVSEDNLHGALAEVQKLTDTAIKKLDDGSAGKEKDILEV